MIKSPHLDLAKRYWKNQVKKGDYAIDATAGNGHDALFLAELVLTANSGGLFCYDIQEKALANTSALLKSKLDAEIFNRVSLIQKCHSNFCDIPLDLPISLIVYNLGYLPSGDKSVTTMTSSTLKSIESALHRIRPGGALSITAYPGHEEGRREEATLIEYLEKLESSAFTICYHKWLNRPLSPTLFWLLRK